MEIVDVLDQSDTLVGQKLKVEGIILQQRENPSHRNSSRDKWFIGTPEFLNTNDISQRIRIVPETYTDADRTELKKWLHESAAKSTQRYAERVKMVIEKQMQNIKTTLTLDDLYRHWQSIAVGSRESLEMLEHLQLVDMLSAVSSASHDSEPRPKMRQYIRIISFEPYFESVVSEFTGEYIVYQGYVVGELVQTEEGLGLHHVTEMMQQSEGCKRCLKSVPSVYDSVAENTALDARPIEIVQSPTDYFGRQVRLSGVLIALRSEYYIVGKPVYVSFHDNHHLSIRIQDQPAINKLSRMSRGIGGYYDSVHSILIVGGIVPSTNEAFPVAISHIQSIILQYNALERIEWTFS